jgi:hypothetical protein
MSAIAAHTARVAATLTVAAAFALAVLAARAAASPPATTFVSRFLSFEVGTMPQALAVGDLDGDGNADLLLTHTGGNMAAPDSLVRVFMGDGKGGFTAKGDYKAGASPLGLTVADWDRDGKADVAVACSGSKSVALLLGAGDGTLRAGPRFAAGVRPIAVVPADFDRDGKIDFAAVNMGTGKAKPQGLQAVIDSVVSDSSSVDVYRAASTAKDGGKASAGGYRRGANLASGGQPVAATSCDWNADGFVDLVLAERGASALAVWPGKANGAFGAVQALPVEMPPSDVAAGDVTGDGRADLLAPISAPTPDGKQSWALAVWTGGGDGNPRVTRFEDRHCYRLALTDFDQDGKSDVVALGRDGVALLRGVGDGTFAPPVYERVNAGSSFAVAKLDGDDKLDLVCTNPTGQAVALLFGNAGLFGAAAGTGAEITTGAGPGHLLALDLDRDDKRDLVATNTAAGSVSALLNQGGGNFARTDFETGEAPTFTAGGDVDGDGDNDLVVMMVRGRASEIVLLRNRGDGGFERRVQIATGVDPASVVLADVTGDDKLDLLVPRNSQPEVLVYAGRGDGAFQPPSKVALGHLPNHFATGDLNGDGKLDFAAADTRKLALTACLGKGDGTFTASPSIRSKLEPSGLAIADVNEDRKADLVVTGRRTSRAAFVLAGVGDGTFGQRTDIAVGPGAGAATLVDLDGNGRLDLVAPDAQLGAATVLLREADGAFGQRRDYGTGPDPSAIAIADLDGDGRLDLAVSSRGTGTVSILPQRAPGAP